MGAIGGALGNKVDVVNLPVSTPTIKNLSMPLKDTEYSYALPAGSKRFKIQNRQDGLLKMAFSSWSGNPDYWTVFPGQQDEELMINPSSVITLYLQSPMDNQEAEIRTWD